MAPRMRVGSELKAARKKAGITVEVISKRTKIKVTRLVALEKNDFKNLPTGLYLFSVVRAYAREVRVDPEPIVERLRAEFADKDALDALHALDAAGALNAKTPANSRRSTDERPRFFRNAAIAVGAVFMAAVGAGAYRHNMGRTPREVGTTKVERPSTAQVVNTTAVPLSPPVPATTFQAAVDVPQQTEAAAEIPAPTKPHRRERRPATITPELQEAVATAGAAQIEEPADTSSEIDEPRSEATVPPTAP